MEKLPKVMDCPFCGKQPEQMGSGEQQRGLMIHCITLSEKEQRELKYLQRAGRPLWWGHLKRGEPLQDGSLKRWRDLGLVEAVGTTGYVLTEKGRAALPPTRT